MEKNEITKQNIEPTKTVALQVVPEPDTKRYGAEEPTKSFIIPFVSTKGDEAIALYNKGRFKLEPWQESLLCSIMGRDEEDLWTHQKFGYSIPRRNGKSELAIARCLWGLVNGEHILYTAQNTSTAHAIWERLSDLCETLKLQTSTFRAFGREHIYVKDGGRIEFRTRTTTGGMGEGYDLLVIDEAQEYTINQQAALKYIVTASSNPQTLMLGTPPTPSSGGTVFPTYRNRILSGGGKYSGWAEWSIPEKTTLDDIDALYQSNPSLGRHLTLRAIESEAADIESDIDLNIQRFGLWFKYSLKSVISKPDWEACEVKELPEMTGGVYIGIKFGKGSGNVALGVARKTKDNKIFIEAIDCRTTRGGYDWIVQFIQKCKHAQEVVIDGDNGKSSLNDKICELIDSEELDIPYPTIPKTGEIIKANSLFEQGITSRDMIHMEQPSLSQVVTNTEKRAIGTNGGFGYSSQNDQMDIALLDCVMLAHWICYDSPDEEYEQLFDY